jgi:SAM-dependent methyltransferase
MRRDFKKSIRRQTTVQINYSGTQELLDGEQGLAGYNLDVVSKLSEGLKLSKSENFGAIVDFGAGTGALAEVWKKEFGVKPICVEIDPQLIGQLKKKGFSTYADIEQIRVDITSIYSSNVLEHIEDDVEALRRLKNKMRAGGMLAIYVPALPFLFSDLDRNVGHFRRYKKNELVEKVSLAGFEIRTCYYNDCLGVLASIALRVLGYKNKVGLGSKKSLIFYDRFIYPISMILDKVLFKHVIGKNLFLFAENII